MLKFTIFKTMALGYIFQSLFETKNFDYLIFQSWALGYIDDKNI